MTRKFSFEWNRSFAAMTSLMCEDEQLRSIAKWRTKKRPDRTVRLGETVQRFVENCVLPRQSRFETVTEFWRRLLPAELAEHCKIADISGGLLKVLVNSPSYRHELQLCSAELLSQLQAQCPKARIKKIKIVLG